MVSSLAARQRESPTAQVTVDAGAPGCAVQLDADTSVKSDAQGKAHFRDVDPSDHYIHVRCPSQQERGHLISPHADENLQLPMAAAPIAPGSAQSADPNQEPAEAKIKLRELVKQAVELRGEARLDEAVKQLREAAELDPENSDLHRELGITFLLAKDWKRARVEMLEAIRHDPTDADAHNGLGYALEKLGEVQPALDQYRVATRLDPDDPSYRQHYLDALAREASERPVKEKKR
jgi:tetratricopeptide (TPR) repeat protein